MCSEGENDFTEELALLLMNYMYIPRKNIQMGSWAIISGYIKLIALAGV